MKGGQTNWDNKGRKVEIQGQTRLGISAEVAQGENHQKSGQQMRTSYLWGKIRCEWFYTGDQAWMYRN